MKSTRIGYLFLLPSLFGVAGLQRFYPGKYGTGLLWLMTGGLFGVGTLYDAVTMRSQVRESNLRERFRDALDYDEMRFDRRLVNDVRVLGAVIDGDETRARRWDASYESAHRTPAPTRETPEHAILRTAKKNGGFTTPSIVALESGISTDAAKEHLDTLVNKGFAELRVKKTGLVVYVFPEFLSENLKDDFEDF